MGSSWLPGMTRTPSCFQRSRVAVIVRMCRNGLIVGACHRAAFLEILSANATENRDRRPDRIKELFAHRDLSGEAQRSKENSMGSTTDKVKGATNEAIGKAKQGVGEAVGSDQLAGRRRGPGNQGQGPEGRWRRQGSHQGRRQQGGHRREQESLIGTIDSEWRRPAARPAFSCWPSFLSSCPALCRASTSLPNTKVDVDGRDKPGHDELRGLPLWAVRINPGAVPDQAPSGLTTLIGAARGIGAVIWSKMSVNWNLVFVAGDVADVRRADHVVQRQQGIVGVAQRLLLEHVDRRHARAARRAARRPARPARSAGARLVLTTSAVGFMRARSSR